MAIMSQRLPPLNALKAFEAAARHLSVKKAAAELNVTPAAVSHQIRALEEYLDIQLFHRYNRALELTDSARAMPTRSFTSWPPTLSVWPSISK